MIFCISGLTVLGTGTVRAGTSSAPDPAVCAWTGTARIADAATRQASPGNRRPAMGAVTCKKFFIKPLPCVAGLPPAPALDQL